MSFSTLATVFVVLSVLFYVLLQKYRPFIYDFLIVKMTKEWYRVVLERLPQDAHILDVGIGTGSALFANEKLLREKNITVIGVDYDLDYVKLCQQNIEKRGLNKYVRVIHESIYDYQPSKGNDQNDHLFDAIYFSGSLMIMPDPTRALQHVRKMVKQQGKIYVTQTFEEKKNQLLELMKPLLRFLTTIDFGQVTYASEFFASFERAGLKVEEDVAISNTGHINPSGRSVRLIIGA